MRYGVYLSSVEPFSDPRLLAELAYEAEGEGWDGVFIWDHIGQPNTAADPWVVLAAMAMRTQRVKLGPVVTPVARRRPWKLARETVTLDQLSGGRLILGVGLGWGAQEFEVFGEDGDARVRAEKLDEGLDVLVGLWRGESFSYSGKHYRVTEARLLPTPVQRPRIPVWACGTWPTAKAPFRRAARWDGVLAILDPHENRAIRPDEVAAVRTYVAQHRDDGAQFDTVVIMWSEGGHDTRESDGTAAYAEAGVTWWLEDLSTDRFGSLEEVRARLHKGPPNQ